MSPSTVPNTILPLVPESDSFEAGLDAFSYLFEDLGGHDHPLRETFRLSEAFTDGEHSLPAFFKYLYWVDVGGHHLFDQLECGWFIEVEDGFADFFGGRHNKIVFYMVKKG